ncbi:MAG: ATP synthase subunit I [Clostridiales bacterium]|nr:ATP synthase subunit I [Clostridiales bacterium]
MTKYTIIATAIAVAVSLLFAGRSGALFAYGLALGVCAAVINMNILCASIERSAAKGGKGPVQAGFAVRAAIYAGAFWLAVTTAGVAGVGAAVGFFLPRAAMYIVLGLRPAVRRKLGKEPRAVYVIDTRSKVFFKAPRFVAENYNDGARSYVTHRHFRRIRQAEG